MAFYAILGHWPYYGKQVEVTALLEATARYLPWEKVEQIRSAYDFAAKAHEGQTRKSGEPFIEHPLSVALILAELQLDATAVKAALLHDVPEDSAIPLTKIEELFGKDVGKLVDGVTKLAKLSLAAPGETRFSGNTTYERQAENLRKMLVAMAEDLRVVFIKLADRLHNMRTLDAMPPEKQKDTARETLEIYAPLAHRLGIWEIKWQLEDLAFRFLEPQHYKSLARLLASKRAQREEFIGKVIDVLRSEFEKVGIKAEITGRAKHIYSLHQKAEKYAVQGRHFDEIYDLLAIRVLVVSVNECYTALGAVHNLWHPIPGSFDDYIANPKPNGYQSLHTAVLSMSATPLEIQIRTYEMHRLAEYGVAAHWRYKEGDKAAPKSEDRISWLRQLADWHRDLAGAEEFLESVKTDIFNDQVFVFTPGGEIKDLPKGATPLDFAYRVHTELGHRCVGAKVNGKLVGLDYRLRNGEVVEIVTTKKDKGPSRDWLNPNLGYVKTSHAITKIRQWFKKQERTENIEKGRELLEKEFRHLGLKIPDFKTLAHQNNCENIDEFLAAVGYGGLSAHSIALSQVAAAEAPHPVEAAAPAAPARADSSGVSVMGIGDVLTKIAGCCRPLPGEDIIGYVTRSQGVTIHRADCHNVLKEEEPERLIRVEWGRQDQFYPTRLQVLAWDRVGLVRDISTLIADEKVNISNMTVAESPDRVTSITLDIETKGLTQLARLISKMEGVKGVTSINRLGDDSKSRPSA
ncbi:(p)ppGpp synthetase [Dehalogenimonas alkenigignens]|uniref:(P)ppGpp synthetase, RelA/SpoT family n=1 Tax=Dehalogenimonas alkenigignens TaxID=1217799 RepID=A0A0W0GGL7_9CHLR|nr:bifunctional (p)ppGpp synthetase/guanosine-3',5'-bis(diphosphate) 3'-pyrophosphohydrolase [Dehalogenimonas alkenigignens]KTB47692.1 (p)ppGpp synthetase, RelA/SpoT family [Dehalogenimonas alkenigignens]PVV84040.1 (p)ppGpp synthetase [Dehalogenimonas alkenigignens]